MTDTERFFDTVDDFDTCIMTTFTKRGTPHGRPMHVAERDGSTLWFVTSVQAGMVKEIAAGDPAVLTFQSRTAWVAATGTTTMTQDSQRVAELWSEPMKAWFPNGPDDPQLVAIGVEVESGEYWSMDAGDLVSFAFGVAKSVVTDSSIDGDREGEHGEVRL